MTTAVIGTGGIGSVIARELASGGETLRLRLRLRAWALAPSWTASATQRQRPLGQRPLADAEVHTEGAAE
jgi:3-hydroxyisobutyrate dehydrogenase-like beta-hydroxyacid dehydrogenase